MNMMLSGGHLCRGLGLDAAPLFHLVEGRAKLCGDESRSIAKNASAIGTSTVNKRYVGRYIGSSVGWS